MTQFQNLINQVKKDQLAKYKTILDQSKGQIIFYGPPGTGKTYIAKQLANMITGINPDDKWTTSTHRKIVQFHPSYSYEDFVQGIRPVKDGEAINYVLQPGIFQKLCQPLLKLPKMTWRNAILYVLFKELEKDGESLHYNAITQKTMELGINPEGSESKATPQYSLLREITENIRIKKKEGSISIFQPSVDDNGKIKKGYYELNDKSPEYNDVKNNLPESIADTESKVLIIDEINRGNLSKIFGELIYALEYRDEEIVLQYKEFSEGNEYGTLTVPLKDQLMVIGTMNTADRSIILFDAALRRRFSFIPLFPDYDLLAQALDIDVAYAREKFNKKLTGIVGAQENKILSILALEIINSKLADDVSIGREKQIGHTFLLELQKQPENFEKVWKRDILPLLEEYYFDDTKRIKKMFNAEIYTVEDGIKEFDQDVLHESLTKYVKNNE